MFKSFRVLIICCVRVSLAQAFTEDYIDVYTGATDFPDYWFTPPDCGPNEVFDCTYPCPAEQTCRDREQSRCLEDVQLCSHKCVCQSGFFRNTVDGVCVSEKQCDKCPGPNEYYACGYPCDNVCNTLHLQNKTFCPYIYNECHPSCYCDDGYARNDEGVCIPIHECPIPKCGQNEVYTDCKQYCSNETCSSIVNPLICDNEEPCNQGCVCKDGFFRIEENAPCIPRCACPQMIDLKECTDTKIRVANKKFSCDYLLKSLGIRL